MRGLVLLFLGITLAAEAKLPNIVYILADDLGYNELGCYGQEKIKTPNIDRIAAQGVRFTQHYSGQTVCAPSRCALLTGKHMGHAYIRNNRERRPNGQYPLAASEVTIAEILKSKGYATACVGKWGLGIPGSEGDPNKQGFDLFFGYNCQRKAHYYYPKYLWKNDQKVMYPENDIYRGKNYSALEMKTEALQFVRESKDKPFFLYWATPIPHVSLQVPDEAIEKFDYKWEEKPYAGADIAAWEKSGRTKRLGYTGHKTPRAAYASMISLMDDNVGQLMKLLDELGIADNTLLIFTSDNGTTFAGGVKRGFFNSLDGLRGHKCYLYEGGIRVPFLARWPGKIKPGTTSDHVSAFWDMMPTLCEMVGAPVPADTDGISMLPTLIGKSGQKQHESLYWEYGGKGGQVAVRMGDWKGIRTRLGRNHDAPIQLYNLSTDRNERNDVAKQHPEVLEKIRRIMLEEHTDSPQFKFKALDGKKQ